MEGGVTKKELLFGDICALRDAKQLRIKPVLLIRMRWLYTLPLILIYFYPVVPRTLWRVKQIIRNPINYINYEEENKTEM